MSFEKWMAWEGRINLEAQTERILAMPNVIVHVARMVHTPAGSAPGGMLFWQPDAAAPPLIFGSLSSDRRVAAYIGKHIFAGTPFEAAPALEGSTEISIDSGHATARIEIPGFQLTLHLSDFSAASLIHREPLPTAPFHQQGLERAASHACLKVNGNKIDLIIPPAGRTGGPCAVLAPCGIYTR